MVFRQREPKKASRPIEVTELGIVTLVKLVLLLKALLPIEVMELGITTLFKLLQSSKT